MGRIKVLLWDARAASNEANHPPDTKPASSNAVEPAASSLGQPSTSALGQSSILGVTVFTGYEVFGQTVIITFDRQNLHWKM